MARRLTQEEFVEKAKSVHGDKYDYSKSYYISAKEDIEIICRKHGNFFQNASYHLSGCGCDECGGSKKLTTQIFIDRSKVLHNDKYDYSKSNYVNSHIKVVINCPIHGDFNQAPS